MSRSTDTFEAFWAFYLSVHQDAWTRRFHAAATVLGVGCVLFLFPLTLDGRWLWVGPAVAYPLAWFSHAAFEKKPPAMFAHPLWALFCDLRMVRLLFTHRLDAEWRRVQPLVPPAAPIPTLRRSPLAVP